MDINHNWGADVIVGPGGDLSLSDGDTELLQRILRRLMTNDSVPGATTVETVTGDYPYHQTYGGGIPRRIGQNVNIAEIQSQILAQMLQEQSVSQSTPPQVTVVPFRGGVQCHLKFISAISQTPQILEFTVT